MKLNVEEFRKIVHATTANYLITSLHLHITPEKVESAMKSNDGVVSKICTPNLVLEDMGKEAVDMYFNDIKTNLMPYIALLKDETLEMKMLENGFALVDKKRKIKILFCDSSIVNIATKTNPAVDFDIHVPFDAIDDAYMDIKKIAPRFGKIYVGCNDGKLYLETKDGTNYSNSFKAEVDVAEIPDKKFEVCFDYKVFHSVFTSLGDGEDFVFNMAYLKAREAGMIFWNMKDGDFFKEYFIVSKSE
jgi:hypothetical protein